MHNLLRYSLPLLATFAVLFYSGCADDTGGGIGGGVVLGPVISLDGAAGFVSADTDLDINMSTFSVRVTGNDGDADLRSLLIQESGADVPNSRLTISGFPTPNNPQLIPPADADGFTYDITIADFGGTPGDAAYNFILTDANGETASEGFTVNYFMPTTPLALDTMGVFYNAVGRLNGGLDLDSGSAVPFQDTTADLKDQGIDGRIPTGMENWRAQISGANGATVKLVDLMTLPDGTTYESINTQEMVAMAYDSASDLDGDDSFDQLPNTQGEVVSQTIQEGDIFAVLRNDRRYLVRFDTVTYVPNSNTDSYSVSIKY